MCYGDEHVVLWRTLYKRLGSLKAVAAEMGIHHRQVAQVIPSEERKAYSRVTAADRRKLFKLLADENHTIESACRAVGRERSTMRYQFGDTPEWQAALGRWKASIREITLNQQRQLEAHQRHIEADRLRREHTAEAVRLYNDGMTIGSIARLLGRTTSTVSV